MSNKVDLRKQLETDVAMFLAKGNFITKVPMQGKKRFAKPKEEEIVEIEVDHLPEALQKKFFGEE